MVIRMFGDIYKGRRVLVTGHTGFKGSWLVLWLLGLGAKVTGYSLDVPTDPSHHLLLNPDIETVFGDIRDPEAVERIIASVQPDIVFHLAAQSLVRRSYKNPVETFETNVMGTIRLLEACRGSSVRAAVIATSDKCYENQERHRGYSEDDCLGGHDPYSASKAAAEIATAAYRRSFFEATACPLTATVRAGNVIGGGDWSEDRLVPDIIRSIRDKAPLMIRYPEAVRPWQHVLDPLSGYLLLGWRLLEGRRPFASSWNFGPDAGDERTVAAILQTMQGHGLRFEWRREDQQQPHEAGLLSLDCTKAQRDLGWQPLWSFDRAVSMTATWYDAWLEQGRIISTDQLSEYVRQARQRNMVWATGE
jgi:CDP-glucose 4,6-dehydratase